MKINAEDLQLIKKYENIMLRGYYASGREVCELYNRVLGKNARPSNCSSCIRRQIQELVDAANKFEQMAARVQEPTTTPEENKKPEEKKTGKKKTK